MLPEGEQAFDYIGIEMSGSGCSQDLREAVERAAADVGTSSIRCRGTFGPACGPDVVVNVFAALSQLVAPAAVSWAVGELFDKVRDSALGEGGRDVEIHQMTISFPEYDVILLDTSSAHDDVACASSSKGTAISGELLAAIGSFVSSEADKGLAVNSVTLPCAVLPADDKTICIPGVGDQSIWLVDYADGPRWPRAVYDSVNGEFIYAEVTLD